MRVDLRHLSPSALPPILCALFFASGFVALLYQVIWQRLLGLVTGLDLYAVTLIVAVFMAGMGAGSYAGGVWADRLPPSRLLGLFALSETVVALFALASTPLYHDLLYGFAVTPGASSTLLATLGAGSLLVPTFFMGVTLPVLSRALSESLVTAPARIARLYGWNTLGAAMGAWVGSAVVIRTLGYERSLWLGALVNLVAAAATFWLSRRLVPDARAGGHTGTRGGPLQERSRESSSISTEPVRAASPPAGKAWPWQTWVVLYFVSGFLALGLELVWFRLLGVILKSTAFTFPLLLGFYLLGVGGGSLVGRPIASWCARPMRWFLVAQAGVGLYAGLSVTAVVWALRTQAWLEPARTYLAQYDPIEFAFNFLELDARHVGLYLGAPALLILPPTLLMGISFSLLQRGIQRKLSEVGRRVAVLQTANILGSTLGTLVVGIVLIDRWGTAGTLRALTAASGLFLALAALERFATAMTVVRRAAAVGGVLLAVAVALTVPDGATLWGQMHAVPAARIIHREDGTGLAVLTSADPRFRGRTEVYVNGLGQSRIPFRGVHSFLGLVPVLLHPAPRRVVVIGLGSGDTLYSAAGRPETEVALGIEIIAGQLSTLRHLHDLTGYPGLGHLFSDPRIQIAVGDGRRLIMQSSQAFDVIEADALRPSSAYSGTLYSREYFTLLRERLTEGGYAVTWAPTERIHTTFRAVFPYVAEVSPMLIGSRAPIAFDPDAIRRRAARPETQVHYARAGIDLMASVEQLVTSFVHLNRGTPVAAPSEDRVNTDLFPRDELRVP
ncbi:MAG: fused MFS/spermidine synthase [Vicinamibacterales bacterium]